MRADRLVGVAAGLVLAGCGGVRIPPPPGTVCPLESTAETACECYVLVGPALEWRLRDCPPVPGDCQGPEDNEPPGAAPRCSDEPSRDPTKWSDCWSCNGRSGGVWRYIPPEVPDATPTPEPDPAPTPTPGPTPTPTPEPTPDPTPEPTPEPTPDPGLTCPELSAFTCAEGDSTALGEATVARAVRAVIRSRPAYLVGFETRGPEERAKIRAPDPDAEPDIWSFSRAVAEELRREGLCAWAGDPSGRSPDEVLLLIDGTAEAWDLAKCGAHEPDGRYCVGTDLLHQPFDCVLTGSPPEDEPEPAMTCTVPGIGDPDTGELRRFPSRRAACLEFLGVSERTGHLRSQVIDGQRWVEDLGMGGGWYDLDCRRYLEPGGAVVHENWFKIRCSP